MKIIFSDEAHLISYVNKQNCRIWGTENPHAYIGPFFFENVQGEAVTANDDSYRSMLKEFLFTKVEEKDVGNIWIQQDGATCLTAETTLDVLRGALIS